MEQSPCICSRPAANLTLPMQACLGRTSLLVGVVWPMCVCVCVHVKGLGCARVCMCAHVCIYLRVSPPCVAVEESKDEDEDEDEAPLMPAPNEEEGNDVPLLSDSPWRSYCDFQLCTCVIVNDMIFMYEVRFIYLWGVCVIIIFRNNYPVQRENEATMPCLNTPT